MKKIDVSVVLNMHREALYLRPTLVSLEACANEARNEGINVELIAVFDRPDESISEVFHQTPLKAFEQIKTATIDVGSFGLARNAGIDLAEDEFVWTFDGDDLVSRNSIVELFKTARNHKRRKCGIEWAGGSFVNADLSYLGLLILAPDMRTSCHRPSVSRRIWDCFHIYPSALHA